MALQPLDERNNLQNTNEYISLETSQYSQNAVLNPQTTFNFSSVTNTVNDWPLNIEDVDKIDKMMNDAQSEIENKSFDEVLDCWTEELDMMELKNIDQSIEDRTMSVKDQPPIDIRRRYESEEKRFIEESRSKPMAINLPNFEKCKLNSDESFWVQLYLITTDENPSKKVYIHEYKLEYCDDNLPTGDHKLACVLLTQEDIQKRIKELPRISIIKKLLKEYTFELKPFDPSPTDDKTEIYENEMVNGVVRKAKVFRDLYNLTSSRIAAKLFIKKNKTWYTTDIKCETDVMKEKETKSTKRSASSDNDECQVHRPSPPKKRKQS